jgi:hypothetical protein
MRNESMSNTSRSSKEAQHKIVFFLKEEVAKLIYHHSLEPKKKIMKAKNREKKRQKLYQKIEIMMKIYPLDTEVREMLHILQQEIKDST